MIKEINMDDTYANIKYTYIYILKNQLIISSYKIESKLFPIL